MSNFTGGCVCGAIRYEVSARPIMMFNCHCRDCQRTTGGAFTPVVYVPAKAFKITKGSPRYYSTPSEMVGHNKRGFCPECGSRLSVERLNTVRALPLPVWTIRACSNRKRICGFPTRSPGITWIRICRRLRSIRQVRKKLCRV